MKRILLLTVILIKITACYTQELPRDQVDLEDPIFHEKIDDLIKLYMDIDIFSGVVLIAKKGKPTYHKAFGLSNRANNTQNTLDTKFDIGSMNKTFTKMVILQLVEDKQLKLDDQLSRILPAFASSKFSNITVEHLLNHTAGFGDYYMSPGFFDLDPSEKNIASLTRRINEMPLLFEPGSEREYSNSGYILLGAIIEKITNKSYHQNVKERIVEPLKLKNTFVENIEKVTDRAIGYYKNMKGELLDNRDFGEVPNPDGGFQSTALDVLKFYQEYHYGERVINNKTKMMDEFYRMIQEHNTSGGAIPHAGGFNGANSVNFEILRDKISIVILANMDEPVAEDLGAGILALIRGKEAKKPSLPAIENVYKSYQSRGIEYVSQNFHKLIDNFHPTDPKALILNRIGYAFLKDKKMDNSIEIFQLNTKLFPQNPNVWDSLGEAYRTKGEREMALKYYTKALELDPEFPSALEAVRELKR